MTRFKISCWLGFKVFKNFQLSPFRQNRASSCYFANAHAFTFSMSFLSCFLFYFYATPIFEPLDANPKPSPSPLSPTSAPNPPPELELRCRHPLSTPFQNDEEEKIEKTHEPSLPWFENPRTMVTKGSTKILSPYISPARPIMGGSHMGQVQIMFFSMVTSNIYFHFSAINFLLQGEII